jgi:hypothetical protein
MSKVIHSYGGKPRKPAKPPRYEVKAYYDPGMELHHSLKTNSFLRVWWEWLLIRTIDSAVYDRAEIIDHQEEPK